MSLKDMQKLEKLRDQEKPFLSNVIPATSPTSSVTMTLRFLRP